MSQGEAASAQPEWQRPRKAGSLPSGRRFLNLKGAVSRHAARAPAPIIYPSARLDSRLHIQHLYLSSCRALLFELLMSCNSVRSRCCERCGLTFLHCVLLLVEPRGLVDDTGKK